MFGRIETAEVPPERRSPRSPRSSAEPVMRRVF